MAGCFEGWDGTELGAACTAVGSDMCVLNAAGYSIGTPPPPLLLLRGSPFDRHHHDHRHGHLPDKRRLCRGRQRRPLPGLHRSRAPDALLLTLRNPPHSRRESGLHSLKISSDDRAGRRRRLRNASPRCRHGRVTWSGIGPATAPWARALPAWSGRRGAAPTTLTPAQTPRTLRNTTTNFMSFSWVY